MATMNKNEVTVGAAAATGAIFVAPQGTALPTDATTQLTAEYTLLGFTSDAGVQVSESSSNQSIRAWEARAEVYNVRTEYTESVSFMPIQCNADVAKLMWGNDAVIVNADGSFTAKHHGGEIDPVAIVIETTPRENIVKRYCGTFQLTERGASTMDGTQVDGRQLTFNAIADEEGYTMYEHTAFIADADEGDAEEDEGE